MVMVMVMVLSELNSDRVGEAMSGLEFSSSINFKFRPILFNIQRHTFIFFILLGLKPLL